MIWQVLRSVHNLLLFGEAGRGLAPRPLAKALASRSSRRFPLRPSERHGRPLSACCVVGWSVFGHRCASPQTGHPTTSRPFALRPLARSSLGTAVAPAYDRAPVFVGYRGVSPGRGRVGCAPLLLRRASRGRPVRSLPLRSRSLGRFRALRYARHGGKSLARAPRGRSCNSVKIRCAHVGRVRLCPRAWLHFVPSSRLAPKSGSRQASRSALSR